MGTRIWWVREEHEEPDMVADKWQTYDLSDLMQGHFLEFDKSPPHIDEEYFYEKAKWRELHEHLPVEVGPEGFECPTVYFDVEQHKNVVDGTRRITQERYMSMRPLLKLIAESDRDVYEG